MTNYLIIIVRLLQGLLVTRWMVEYLGQDSYGLWTLLWSFFGYSLLLDFGFGVTVQKYTSVGLYRSDLAKYNSVVSTIFSFHAIMALLILAGTILASFFLTVLFKLQDASPEQVLLCRQCFLLFGIGCALVFPTGMFPEILVGLQRIYLRNYINTISKLVELIGTLLILLRGGGLIWMIVFILVLMLLTNLAMLFFAKWHLPGLRLYLTIDRRLIHELLHFSAFVYLKSLATLVWNRGSTLLLGIFSGLSAVGAFQLSSRLPVMMFQAADAYQENVGPMAAGLHAQGKYAELSRILLNSMRWNSFLATGMSLALICMSGELLEFLFKIEDPLITWGCRIIAMELYIILVFRSIPDKFLVMADYHKFISWIVIAEAGVNVICCLLLLPYFSFIAVTLIALGIKAVSTFALILPLLLRYMKMKYYVLVWKIALLQLAAAIPMCLTLIGLKKVISPGDALFLYLLAASSAGAAVYLLFSYILTIQKDEKRLVRNKIMALGSEIRQKLCRH